MRVLTITSLFPNATSPAHGVFVLRRVQAMRDAGAEVEVVAPVPWAPPGPLPPAYARMRSVPGSEVIDGIRVGHPRYLMIPKIGARWQHRGYARAVARTLAELTRRARPDILDAHYLYPDACGVAHAAARAGLPFACTARGSDVKVLAHELVRRRRIRDALSRAAAVISVSADLAAGMRELGLCVGPIRVIPNGVDAAMFRPLGRGAARARLGIPEGDRVVVSVGHVTPFYGQDILVRAIAHPGGPAGVRLFLVGDTRDVSAVERARRESGAGDRVRLVGRVPPEDVPWWFCAADAAAFLPEHAGSPNALLEALACGTPCVVSDLPEMREAIGSSRLARAVTREPGVVARELRGILEGRGDRDAPSPSPRSWADVGREVLECFRAALGAPPR